MPPQSEQSGPGRPLERWEELATDAVGDIIEFWGFKRNHGRTWALLFLRGDAASSADLQAALQLSKGAVSMVTSDLERWGVVRRTRVSGSAARHYEAELDFWQMISRVFRDRELEIVSRVRDDLDDAMRLAMLSDDVPQESLSRLRRMKQLASVVSDLLSMFLQTSRLDVSSLASVLVPRGERRNEH